MKVDVNEIFNSACDLKEEARKSYTKYKEASELFNKAGSLTSKWMNEQIKLSLKLYGMAISSYYFYEEADCLANYYYEERHIEKTIEYLDQSRKWIKTALDSLNKASEISYDDKELLSELSERKVMWEYYMDNDAVFRLVALARKEFDNKQFIDAMDFYRAAAQKSEDLLDKVINNNKDIFPLSLQRISKGNYVGMMVNVSFMFIRILEQEIKHNGDEDKSSNMIEKNLLEHLLKAHKFSIIAYEENPDSIQYIKAADQLYNAIQTFLEKKKKSWKSIYIDFDKEDVIKQIMKKIDNKTYKKVENDLINDNKVMKVWGIGSFFAFLFVLIIGSLLLVAHIIDSFWILLCIIIGAEALFLIVGGLIARTIGDLSEKGFLELIKIVFTNQFKFFRLINKNNSTNNQP